MIPKPSVLSALARLVRAIETYLVAFLIALAAHLETRADRLDAQAALYSLKESK